MVPDPEDVRRNFKRILLIRFRLMGDVLLMTPVARALRARFPQARIALLTDEPADEMVRGHPALDEIILFKRHDDAKLTAFQRLKRYARVVSDIRRKGFDLVLNLHPHGERGGLVTWLSGARVRVGYDRPGSRTFWYNVRAPYDTESRYRVEHLLDALRAIGIEAKAELPSVSLTADDKAYAEKLLAGGKRPVVVIHPGRPDSRRAWMADRYAQVADALVAKHGARILFSGVRQEKERVEGVRRGMRQASESLVGASVKQLAAVMQRADLYIGMDSSPLHLASAVGLPTVSLFSYYSPRAWKPIGDEHIAIRKQLPDHPCNTPTCCQPGDAPCMRNISVDEVLAAAAQLLRPK
jgi:predicted lipopolysaccharide heptosyltransferase III